MARKMLPKSVYSKLSRRDKQIIRRAGIKGRGGKRRRFKRGY